MVWWFAAALAADPTLVLEWKGASSQLQVIVPEGHHVAPDAPVVGHLSTEGGVVHWEGWGPMVAEGLPGGEVRGLAVRGELSLSYCSDTDGTCLPWAVAFEAQPSDKKKGEAVVVTRDPSMGSALSFPAQVDAQALFDEALTQAQATGQRVLVDFSAVWCPPCALLGAEVIEAHPRPNALEGYVVVAVDVDAPSSFALKDRYGVTGYPTLLVVTPEGELVQRQVGYPGRDATLVWLEAGQTAGVPSAEVAPGAEAARRAWEAVQSGDKEGAAAALAQAGGAEDTAPFRLARARLEARPEDARWLAEAGMSPLQWAYAYAGAEADDLRQVVYAAVVEHVAVADPVEAADLADLAATFRSDVADQRAWWSAAAALVRAQYTGDPAHDKGLWGWHAWLLEHAGHGGEALVLLDEAIAAYPDEPTFYVARARMLLRMGRGADAAVSAQAAVERSWGDNLLTSTLLLARALEADGRRDEGEARVTAVLEEVPEPGELDVRSHRYRAALEAWRRGDG